MHSKNWQCPDWVAAVLPHRRAPQQRSTRQIQFRMLPQNFLSLPAWVAAAGLLISAGARAGSLPAREQILADMVRANSYFTNTYREKIIFDDR